MINHTTAPENRKVNTAAIKLLVCCTHFLAHQYIPHTTKFDKFVDLVTSCGDEDLKHFLGKLLHILLRGPYVLKCYSIMADECTDVTAVEELSVFCHWREDGLLVEHFLKIIHFL